MIKNDFVKKRFTDDELYRANNYDLLEIASSYGLTVKHFSRDTYTTDEHDSLKLTPGENKWIWKSQNIGGGPIQLKMSLGNLSWVEAVNALLGTESETNHSAIKFKHEPKPKKEFALPPQSDNFKHLYAYLTKTRGIHADVLTEFVKNKSIYESVYTDEVKGYKFSNCTFVGRDSNDVPKYAALRSTNTNFSFKGEVEGSDKEFAFSRRGSDSSLFTFEAPIEILSFLSLLKMDGKESFNSHMIANGGVSLLALNRYLKDHTDDKIEDIFVCTNNDEAGHNSYLKVIEEHGNDYNIHRLSPQNYDWNNDLTISLKIPTHFKNFKLPINPLSSNCDMVYALLVNTMKIDKDLVDRLISEKLIYQTIFSNCAFVGKNKEGIDKSSYIVSTNTMGDRYENYTEGSETNIPFSITGQNESLCVFKHPIELLSYLSLVKHHNVSKFNNHCISYGQDPKAIVNYIKMNPEIKNAILCVDKQTQMEIASSLSDAELEQVTFKMHLPKSESFSNDLSFFLDAEQENELI